MCLLEFFNENYNYSINNSNNNIINDNNTANYVVKNEDIDLISNESTFVKYVNITWKEFHSFLNHSFPNLNVLPYNLSLPTLPVPPTPVPTTTSSSLVNVKKGIKTTKTTSITTTNGSNSVILDELYNYMRTREQIVGDLLVVLVNFTLQVALHDLKMLTGNEVDIEGLTFNWI